MMLDGYSRRLKLAFAVAQLFSLGYPAHRCDAQSAQAPAPNPSATNPAIETFLGLPPGESPCVVRAGFYLEGIDSIDEEAETFEFTGVLTLTWKDERQAFDPDEAGVKEKIYQGDYQFNELAPAWFPQVMLVNRAGLFETSATILRVEPDGTNTLRQTVDAIAKTTLDMRKVPFDSQSLDAVFEVFGFDRSEVQLVADGSPDRADYAGIRVPQWKLGSFTSSAIDAATPHDTSETGLSEPVASSRLVLTANVERKPLFLVRLIVMPLMLIVLLSWSIFWMDRSSLGDRINLSFVGILTVVAYQIVVGDIMPRISYPTLLNTFLDISFYMMCAAAVVNLVVGAADMAGKVRRGERIDHRCRIIFPATYFGLIGIALGIYLLGS
jgi:hypothetical protein